MGKLTHPLTCFVRKIKAANKLTSRALRHNDRPGSAGARAFNTGSQGLRAAERTGNTGMEPSFELLPPLRLCGSVLSQAGSVRDLPCWAEGWPLNSVPILDGYWI